MERRCWLEVAIDERLGASPGGDALRLEPLLAAAAAAAPAGAPASAPGAADDGLAAVRGGWPPPKCGAAAMPSYLPQW